MSKNETKPKDLRDQGFINLGGLEAMEGPNGTIVLVAGNKVVGDLKVVASPREGKRRPPYYGRPYIRVYRDKESGKIKGKRVPGTKNYPMPTNQELAVELLPNGQYKIPVNKISFDELVGPKKAEIEKGLGILKKHGILPAEEQAPDKEKDLSPEYKQLAKIQSVISKRFAYFDSTVDDPKQREFSKGLVLDTVIRMVVNMDYKKLPMEVLDELFAQFNTTFMEAMRGLEADMYWER